MEWGWAVLGKAVSHMQLTHMRPHKNVPWTWTISLARDKEPTQPVLGLLPCVGISSPVSSSVYVPLFCLSVCILWHLANSITISVLRGEGTGSFYCSMRRVQAGQLLPRETMGDWHPLLKLILLCLFSGRVKHCCIQCLTVLCFLWWLQYQLAWGDALELLFLAVVRVMIFAVCHEVGVLLWDH